MVVIFEEIRLESRLHIIDLDYLYGIGDIPVLARWYGTRSQKLPADFEGHAICKAYG